MTPTRLDLATLQYVLEMVQAHKPRYGTLPNVGIAAIERDIRERMESLIQQIANEGRVCAATVATSR
jgi:hypothetical protein